jgi:hypothetical protein
MGGVAIEGHWMKLAPALFALALLPMVASCGGGRAAEVDAPPKAERSGGFLSGFARSIGADPVANQPNAGPCPLMGVLYDSSRIVKFVGDGSERFANVAYTGEIRGVRGLCRYTGADPIVMNLELDMAFGKGPQAAGNAHVYRYWVAVTRKDSAPIEKQYFDVNVNFPRGEDRVAGPEVIERIVIPRANEKTSGANFEVLVGFDLTDEQLAFNRAGKRFRVDVGARQGGGS